MRRICVDKSIYSKCLAEPGEPINQTVAKKLPHFKFDAHPTPSYRVYYKPQHNVTQGNVTQRAKRRDATRRVDNLRRSRNVRIGRLRRMLRLRGCCCCRCCGSLSGSVRSSFFPPIYLSAYFIFFFVACERATPAALLSVFFHLVFGLGFYQKDHI